MTCPLSQDSEDMENAEDEVGSRASHVDISRQYLRCEGGGRSEEPVRGGMAWPPQYRNEWLPRGGWTARLWNSAEPDQKSKMAASVRFIYSVKDIYVLRVQVQRVEVWWACCLQRCRSDQLLS